MELHGLQGFVFLIGVAVIGFAGFWGFWFVFKQIVFWASLEGLKAIESDYAMLVRDIQDLRGRFADQAHDPSQTDRLQRIVEEYLNTRCPDSKTKSKGKRR